jgi:hypothetical protein
MNDRIDPNSTWAIVLARWGLCFILLVTIVWLAVTYAPPEQGVKAEAAMMLPAESTWWYLEGRKTPLCDCPDTKALEKDLVKCYGLILVPMMLDLQHQLQRDSADAPEKRKPVACPDVKALEGELRTWQRRADMLDDFNRLCHRRLDGLKARKP